MYPAAFTSYWPKPSHGLERHTYSTPVFSTACANIAYSADLTSGRVLGRINSQSTDSVNNIGNLGTPINMFVYSRSPNPQNISHSINCETTPANKPLIQNSKKGESTSSKDSGIVISRSSTPSSSEKSKLNPSFESTPRLEIKTGVKRQLDLATGSPGYDTSPYQPRKKIPSKDIRQNVASPLPRSPLISHSITNGSAWDKLSEEIWNGYLQNKQAENVYKQKMTLRNALYNILLDHFPHCGLYVVGSSMSGLGANNSDMDMCLMLTHSEIDQEREAKHILRHIHKVIKKCTFVTNLQLIHAKVPILKFTDSISGVEVDLNINNAVGIRNTQLLNSYSRIDWRVRPLVLVIKKWARNHDINNAKHQTLSSYSLVLMAIHFLQCRCNPPVLPCLHELQSNKFLPNSDVRQLKLLEDLPPFHSENTQTLGELLIGFLDYYANKFNFSEHAISVRTGSVIPKLEAAYYRSVKNKSAQWKFISIEEPFDRTNTARSVFDRHAFSRILEAFKESWYKLKERKSLSSILTAQNCKYFDD